jgi:hypothetical protein
MRRQRLSIFLANRPAGAPLALRGDAGSKSTAIVLGEPLLCLAQFAVGFT